MYGAPVHFTFRLIIRQILRGHSEQGSNVDVWSKTTLNETYILILYIYPTLLKTTAGYTWDSGLLLQYQNNKLIDTLIWATYFFFIIDLTKKEDFILLMFTNARNPHHQLNVISEPGVVKSYFDHQLQNSKQPFTESTFCHWGFKFNVYLKDCTVFHFCSYMFKCYDRIVTWMVEQCLV